MKLTGSGGRRGYYASHYVYLYAQYYKNLNSITVIVNPQLVVAELVNLVVIHTCFGNRPK